MPGQTESCFRSVIEMKSLFTNHFNINIAMKGQKGQSELETFKKNRQKLDKMIAEVLGPNIHLHDIS